MFSYNSTYLKMPWATPMGGDYSLAKKQIPTLSIFGANDPSERMQEANKDFHKGFKGYFDEYVHEAKHGIPDMTKQLLAKIGALLQISGVSL